METILPKHAISAEKVANVLKTIPGAADVAVDQEPPLPQLQIIANRDRIAQYGLNVSDVADLIELAIGERLSPRFLSAARAMM